MNYTFGAIGIVRTPFQDRYGIPRQSGMAVSAKGVIELDRTTSYMHALKELETFSHLWVVFVFHKTVGWRPMIRPPRLGGKRRVGVLASRSPHRPNPIGLSVVKLEKVEMTKAKIKIHISGHDLMDETPVLDIKPYIPYADSIPNAVAGWADQDIPKFPVVFTEKAESKLKDARHKAMIIEVLELDPRPAFQKRKFPYDKTQPKDAQFGIWIDDLDVKWTIDRGRFLVTDLTKEK